MYFLHPTLFISFFYHYLPIVFADKVMMVFVFPPPAPNPLPSQLNPLTNHTYTPFLGLTAAPGIAEYVASLFASLPEVPEGFLHPAEDARQLSMVL